jgi:macrolide transport system ATP-binding/permease protein
MAAAPVRSPQDRSRATGHLIEVRGLWRIYDLGDVQVEALRGVSLAIAAGEFVAIMGASGSGKSTFMNVLGCLDRPSRGSYRLGGVDVATLGGDELAEIRNRRLGFIFQSFNLLPRTTALENVEVPLYYGDAPLAEQRLRARAALAAVGLEDRARHLPTQLSGGQQQRVAIARALVGGPSLLLADEPTGNLDSRTSEELLALLQELNRTRGITVVLVTHEADVAAFAGRVVTFRDGAILSDVAQTARLARGGGGGGSAARIGREGSPRGTSASRSPSIKLLAMTSRTALQSLRRNKLRSGLTTLGIVIGVAAVIAMVGIGRGADEAVQSQIRGLGTNLLMIVPGATTAAGVRSGWGGASTLSKADAQAIARDCPSVRDISYYRRQVTQVVAGDRNWSTAVQGSPPSFFRVRQWDVTRGHAFGERDEDLAARVAVLGATVVDQLFPPGQDPVGAAIRIKGVPFVVAGVLERKGQTMWGQDQDDVVLVPFSTAERRVLGTEMLGQVDQIHVTARSSAALAAAKEEVTAALRRRHRIQRGEEDDFTVRDLAEFARTSQMATEVMTNLLLSVASISLLVGGIGIMNILLVSVAERTREIGIRIALGAKRRQILLQFLVESTALSMIGGIFGAVLGVAAAFAIAALAAWPVRVPLSAVLGSVLFSSAVGVFFGLYPASRASRLDPIAALRHE